MEDVKTKLAQALMQAPQAKEPSLGGFLTDPQSYKDMARNLLGMLGSPLPNGAGPMMSRRYPELKSDPEYMNKMMNMGLAMGISPKAPQDDALRLAQQRAALPIEQHGLGLPADNTAAQRAAIMFPGEGFHLSRHGVNVDKLDSGVFAIAPFDAVGTHIGTVDAAKARWDSLSGRHPADVKGVTYPVRFANQSPMLNEAGLPWGENELSQKLRAMHDYDNGADYRKFNADSREMIFKENTSIPYVNDVESAGSISHIVPPDNIRSRFAAFDPWRRNAALAAALGVAAPDLLAQENK